MAKSYYDRLREDVRFEEALSSCMNCGICTAICPAAEFYDYDPRNICNIVQSGDENRLIQLLRSETLWYCGQCMSCKLRCPRGNVPGLLVAALRTLAQTSGEFVHSEKGRQQYAIKKTVGENIITSGYCVDVDLVKPEMHPEQGPVWEWYYNHVEDVIDRMGGNYKKEGAGALRLIPKESMDEVKKIFDVTGGSDLYNDIERYSKQQAIEMQIPCTDNVADNEYFHRVYTDNSGNHSK